MEFFYSLGLMAGIFRYITLNLFGSHEMIRITFFYWNNGSESVSCHWLSNTGYTQGENTTLQNITLWEMREHLKCSIKSTYHNFIRHKMEFLDFFFFKKSLSDAKLWNIWLDVDFRLLFCSLFDAKLYFNSHIASFHLSCLVNVIRQLWQLKKRTPLKEKTSAMYLK